jgi:Transmembrane Fragile-X-F protein
MGWQRPRVEWSRASAPSAAPQIALITFIVLKLTGVISWSWWWVLSPLWIGGILLVVVVCALLIGLRWHARRQMRLWVDQLGPEGIRDLLAGKAPPHESGDEPESRP